MDSSTCLHDALYSKCCYVDCTFLCKKVSTAQFSVCAHLFTKKVNFLCKFTFLRKKWTQLDKIVLTFLQKMYNLHKSISVIDAWRHTIDKIHWTFLPQFWKLSLTLFCPLQLPGPAIGSLASPSSCKGQNKVGDNFRNCGGKDQWCLLLMQLVESSIYNRIHWLYYIYVKSYKGTILS